MVIKFKKIITQLIIIKTHFKKTNNPNVTEKIS